MTADPQASPAAPSSTRAPARRRLLDAAGRLFYEHGVVATGVDAVSAEAGTAVGSLYKNFGGKDALVAAYLDEREARWQQHWQTHLDRAATPVDRVLAVFDALASRGEVLPSDRGCADAAALGQLPTDHPAVEVAYAHKRAFLDRLTGLLDGLVPDPGSTAADLFVVYEGAMVSATYGVVDDPYARARAVAARLLGELDATPG